MAENPPNVPGGTPPPGGSSIPPKPTEAAKVQPKKETVRISLPPKPASTATIKLPTMPAGGASGAPVVGAAASVSVPTPAAPVPRPPTSAPGAPAAPATRPPTSTGAPRPAAPAAPAAPGPRPAVAAAAAARRVSGLDVGLAIAAGVVALAAAVHMWLVIVPLK